MGSGTWVTFVAAAACMSAFKNRDEHAVQLQQWIASDSAVQFSSCFKAWWPCTVASLAQMLLLTQASFHGLIAKRFARKAIHMSMGTSYLLFWPTFPDLPLARYFCATVPLCSVLLVLLVGSGALKSQALLGAASRSGRRQELLQGPLLYGLLHIAVTLLMWRTSPAAIASLVMLCIGDGAAELFGVGFGSTNPLPYNRKKSFAGTGACLSLGGVASYAMLLYFKQSDMFGPEVGNFQLQCIAFLSAVVASLAESLTNSSCDNAIVVLSTAAAGQIAYLVSV